MPNSAVEEAKQQLDYKDLFEFLPSGYVVIEASSPSYPVVAASKDYCRLLGVTSENISNQSLIDVIDDSISHGTASHNKFTRSFKACIKSKKPYDLGIIRHTIKREGKKPEEHFLQSKSYPILDDSGKVAYIVNHVRDISEETETRDELQLAKTQLSEALSIGMVGTWVYDLTTNRIVADKGLAQIFDINERMAAKGLSVETLIDVIHPDDRAPVQRLINSVIGNGLKFDAEFRIVLGDGSVRWIIARGHIERDDLGKPYRFPGVVVDITERKESEQALRESEDRLRFMADSMPQLVWISRPDGYTEYFNQKWYDYTGTVPDQSPSDDWSGIIHPDDADSARQSWQKALKTGKPYEFEYRLYDAANDAYRWFMARALPFHDSSGKIIKWYGTCTDIDDYKHISHIQGFLTNAAKKLAASLDVEETLSSITKLSVPNIADWCTVDIYDENEGIRQIDVAHIDPKKVAWAKKLRQQENPKITDNNGVAEVIRTGKPQFIPMVTEELIRASAKNEQQAKLLISIGLHSAIIVPIRIRNKPVGAITFISSESQRHYTNDDFRMAEKLASHVSLAMTNAQLYREAQEEIAERRRLEKELLAAKETLEARVKQRTRQLEKTNAGLSAEIAKRQQAESALTQYSESLARSNQELQDFAYVASHDLQEPLRKIQAFGDLVDEEYGELLGEGRDYLRRMRSAASRMSILIDDLLSFSRVSTKAKPFGKVNLNMVIKDVVSDLETRIKDTGGTVKADDLPVVKADPTQMRQLFQNLIGNALKFHKPHEPPYVKVGLEKTADDADFYTIKITDNGIGFDEKYLDRIFSVFQRLHGRDSYEGTGIGLAVCRKIVERHGGTITAESTKNHGASFIVRLPVKYKEKK